MAFDLAMIEAAVEAILLGIGEDMSSAIDGSLRIESAPRAETLASLTAP